MIVTENAVNGLLVGNVTLHEHPAVFILSIKSFYLTQAELLECRVVVVVHVVDAHNSGTLHILEQSLDKVTANESSSTSHENAFMI